METTYDWLTMAVFAGLVVLLLHRSAQEEPSDSLWAYLPPALGCTAANQLGNNGYEMPALVVLAGVITYIVAVLKPRLRW
jgi:hypothetical protein